jgi:hypothetical protein
MKKIVVSLVALMAAIAINGYSQGSVQFLNDATTRVSYDNATCALLGVANGTLVPTGSRFLAELYYAPDGADPGDAGMMRGQMGAATTFHTVLAGRFSGGVRNTPNTTAPNAYAWFQVRVWEATFGSTYAEALSAAGKSVDGITRQAIVGMSNRFRVQTGPETGPASSLILAGGAGLQGFQVGVVPEPSSIALGALGLIGLFMLRRRS